MMSPLAVGRRAILWMVAIAASLELPFNMFEAVLRRETRFAWLWFVAFLLLFALAFFVERYKLLQEE